MERFGGLTWMDFAIRNKQYITVDNTHQLLYTVYRKGEKKICILY